VSLLVVAHNEAALIDARIQNLLSLDYPRDRLEIIVASDGSTDTTVDRARGYVEADIQVVAFERRRGKPAVLNDLIPGLRGEIVVLADARQRFEVGALRVLTAPFGDGLVGAVSGELVLSDIPEGAGGMEGLSLYWRYEKFIRRSESQLDSTVGATGAIYAIRRDLFEPIPDDTILDDVLIPLRIARRGYRVLFEPRARAYDRAPTSSGEELVRKVRTLAGNFQLFARERWLLSPFRNRLWFQTLSHKGLRLVAPLLQGTALTTNILLAGDPTYRITLVVQLLFYAAALGGCAPRSAEGRNPIVALPYTVCLLSWATMVGFFRFVAGHQRVQWDKRVP
jgi:cellulose synthase/poly-beta-1,6-N-acetylglucosamine synthase-like glycosyltransferase